MWTPLAQRLDPVTAWFAVPLLLCALWCDQVDSQAQRPLPPRIRKRRRGLNRAPSKLHADEIDATADDQVWMREFVSVEVDWSHQPGAGFIPSTL